MEARPIEPAATHDLRHEVLRPHEDRASMAWDGDDDPEALHVGAFDDGVLVAVGSIVPGAAPPLLAADATGRQWRVRGMATAVTFRQKGMGGLVLQRLLEHAGSRGGGLVWCNARVPAVEFYRRAGFDTAGEPWDGGPIGPHIVMHRVVTARRDGPLAPSARERGSAPS